ncbi:hypothetical protein RB195_017296 [Necator americanus]|uniref:Uncharacterized protein n=1 Tax=Necator americanus TaxID=51031 RepID=A0ABR1C4L3_NECAM
MFSRFMSTVGEVLESYPDITRPHLDPPALTVLHPFQRCTRLSHSRRRDSLVVSQQPLRHSVSLFNTTVLPALTYASETWAFRKQEENAVPMSATKKWKSCLKEEKTSMMHIHIRMNDWRRLAVAVDEDYCSIKS